MLITSPESAPDSLHSIQFALDYFKYMAGSMTHFPPKGRNAALTGTEVLGAMPLPERQHMSPLVEPPPMKLWPQAGSEKKEGEVPWFS